MEKQPELSPAAGPGPGPGVDPASQGPPAAGAGAADAEPSSVQSEKESRFNFCHFMYLWSSSLQLRNVENLHQKNWAGIQLNR